MTVRRPGMRVSLQRVWNARSAILAGLLAAVVAIATGRAAAEEAPFETKARQAFMVDAETGSILLSKDADGQFAPASLAKLMTAEVIFEAVQSGKVSLDDTFQVSEHAWRTGGAPSGTSTMFAALKSQIRLDDLIRGIVVQSANDGCIIVAEGLSGSEAEFARLMNERARAIGMSRSVFVNSTGLPAEGQAVSARDMVMLAMHIWKEHPDFYGYYALPDFTWNKIFQRNRNPLLRMGIGADGLQIGFTEGEGYALVGSAAQNGRRVFVALAGMASDKERAEEARRVITWGLNGFERYELFGGDAVIGEASVYGGAKGGVALRAGKPVSILVPANNKDRITARIVYEGPIVAPVSEGTSIGALRVWIGANLTQEVPLFAAENVERGSLHQRAFDAIGELLVGWMR